VLLALGCGSGAMASPTSPDHGQWTDNTNSGGSSPNAASSGQPAPAPGSPAQAPDWSSSHAQGEYPGQDQSPSQNPARDQDEDDDASDAQSAEPGQVRLGVMVMPLTAELRQFFGVPGDRGVLVARVEPSSAASRAGLQVGDVLVRVGGRQVQSGEDVVQALAARQGGRLRIAVMRQGHPLQLFATLPGTRPSSTQDQGGRAL